MRRGTPWRTASLIVAGALFLVGCGSEQEEQVQEEISEVAVIPDDSPPTPASLASAVPTEPPGRESLAGEAVSCDPTSTELAPSATVQVEIRDGAISIGQQSVPAGTIRFEVTNAGEVPHELVVVRAAAPDALPAASGGGVDESAIEEGTLYGEVGTFPAGETCPGVFDLIPGDYVLFCNVVEPDVATNAGHFDRGEWVRFTAT